ncbi:MAG: hypothetical protein R3D00_25610 [Bacteroidia bacterium]
MLTVHPQYITDNKGKKISVILPMKEFRILIEKLEELADIRLYDEAKSKNESSLPIDEAFKLIEAKRNRKTKNKS